ncbi:MAG: trypsin-like peptidase domain-containing protein [Oligoflexia bacterium]|nr:trypsin-like peptidase domain-containing protein [Oligoflexia bacterium]
MRSICMALSIWVVVLGRVTAKADEGFYPVSSGINATLTKVAESTFGIFVINRNTRKIHFQASSVFIGRMNSKGKEELVFITNAHVVDQPHQAGLGLNNNTVEWVITQDSQVGFSGSLVALKGKKLVKELVQRVVAIDRVLDLAIFTVKRPKSNWDAKPIDWNLAEPMIGTDVHSFGYPKFDRRKIWTNGPPGFPEQLVMSSGKVLSVLPELRHLKVRTHILHDADNLPGNSGGPVVDSQARLIGLNFAIGRYNANFPKKPKGGFIYEAYKSRAVRSTLALDFVNSQGLEFLEFGNVFLQSTL